MKGGRMRKLRWNSLALMTVALALQVTGPSPTNPRGERLAALESVTNVPSEVHRILTRSCADCHSNDTVWPWYAHWAPVSWLTVGHVNRGRVELNFSEWGQYSARRRETRLHAICDLSRHFRMPPSSYAIVHPGAKLTTSDAALLCAWTNGLPSAESER
jgi:hypothetical protein